MSKFSGRCDLYDHILMEKMYPSESNPNILESDEFECFEIFKRRTGGVIYQHQKVEVTEANQDFIAANCKQFEIITQTITAPDRRCKGRFKVKKLYTYNYYGKEYLTLKELNKKEVYIPVPIKFETILDLIPYYPYVISFCASSPEGETIYIANKSEIDYHVDSCLKYGHSLEFVYYFKKILQNHYVEVVKRLNTEKEEINGKN